MFIRTRQFTKIPAGALAGCFVFVAAVLAGFFASLAGVLAGFLLEKFFHRFMSLH